MTTTTTTKQADKFDLIIIQNYLRRFYIKMENEDFKLIIKEKII